MDKHYTFGGIKMCDRDTRNSKQPTSESPRPNQFADDVFESTVEFAKDLSAIRRGDNSEVPEKKE